MKNQHIILYDRQLYWFVLIISQICNQYVHQSSSRQNGHVNQKREMERREGKISQQDRRNKKNERKTKEQETGNSIIVGRWPNSHSVTSPMREPFPSAVALLVIVRQRIGNGRRTRIILLVVALKNSPFSCVSVIFYLIHWQLHNKRIKEENITLKENARYPRETKNGRPSLKRKKKDVHQWTDEADADTIIR